MKTFTQVLNAAWQAQNSLLCVGLDPELERLPLALKAHADGLYAFCKSVIDAAAPYACAFKPQIAYFSAQRAEPCLERLIQYIHEKYPGSPVILDTKRGDIGSTAKQYAREAFERYQADAVTVNPYMGFDSITPYFEYADKGVILLCRTSNPGGNDLQFLNTEHGPLYQVLARLVAEQWNTTGQLGLVVGATFPEEIAAVRNIVGNNMPLLVPGIGTQGGDLKAALDAGLNQEKTGLLINVSRSIMYAFEQSDKQQNDAHFAQAIALEAQRFCEGINLLRAL